MPKCHYVLAILLSIVIPVFNVIIYIKLLASDVRMGPIFAYFTFYAILTIILTLFFLISLLDVFTRAKLENDKASRDFEVAKEKLEKSEGHMTTNEGGQAEE